VVDVAREALDRYGFKGFKFHINVQRFHPDDPRILPVYELLVARGAVLLIHVGSAPWPNEYDGFPRFERVMTMFPELKVIVAHMGQFETRRHLELMERCPNMYLDTTAAMAPHSAIYRDGHGAGAADVTDADLVRWQDRILFGSDFPNTPHSYDDERRPIWERPVPPAVHRKIFGDNARRLLGL
jgi:predicted TIM-barrel fold metal-dependent hydrolase